MIPAALYLALFHTVGFAKYGAYLCLAYLAHFAVAGALCISFAKRFGRVVGFSIGTAFLFFGGGSQNILWSFQVGFMLSILGYLIGRSSLEDPVVRDRTLLVALILSLGSSGIGVPVFAALFVEAVARRRRLGRLWPFAVVGSGYFIWYFVAGTSDTNFDYLRLIPKYARDSAGATIAASFDFTLDWGLVALGLLLGTFLLVRVRSRRISPASLGAVAFLSVFWILTCLSRAQFWDVGAGRYVYAASVPMLVILSESIPRRTSSLTKYLVVTLCGLSIWATWSRMDSEGRWYKEWGQSVAAELRALEIYRANAAFDYFPDKVRAPDIFADVYFKTTKDFRSSPAATTAEIARFSNAARIEFDRVSLELKAVTVTIGDPVSNECTSQTTSVGNPRIRLEKGISVVKAVDGDVVIAFRRYANRRLDVMHTIIPRGKEARLTVLEDGINRPWFVAKASGDGQVCLTN